MNNLVETLRGLNSNYASQLVALYNGSHDSSEIIRWISQIIKDGDSREIPFFTQNAPDLVPEEPKRILSTGTQGVNTIKNSLIQRVKNVILLARDYSSDPRIGPSFLLFACLSFGTIWLKNTTPAAQSTNRPGETRNVTRHRGEINRSITDEIPKDAVNMLSSDSDSE